MSDAFANPPPWPRSRVVARIYRAYSARGGRPPIILHRLDCGHEVASPLEDALPDGAPVLCGGCACDRCGGLGRIADAPCSCSLGDAGRVTP